ncbi:MAG: GNAT family N-acetyltransferase [Oscillospiraceae bacterium]|nr:GNAT family N-acetyltransferase [Oscillospiraceae bacterium]
MNPIRPASAADASRIAEIIITNYRVNFYPFFRNDPFYFGELNVVDMAAEYAEGTQALQQTYVYDDGVVKGVLRVCGDEVEKLYVEPQFQSQGIGAALLEFAISEMHVTNLWALEYNKRGIAFYSRHGFLPNGETMTEDEWVPLIRLVRQPDSKEQTV